jgi:phosphoribosyl-ATP pyrophosphohydrolase/phosphoribosyl-AMP cyclohydrolase/histidinol dehydrogenase
MTAIPARVAGVRDVTVVSPKPTRETLAAAAIAGADRVLAVGGAQAIAAAAFGADDEHVALGPVDVIVGPGNAYVTEAKRQVSGRVRIDGLNGPSELLVVADASADAGLVAADLLAQAEHDVDARALLIAIDADGRTAFVDAVNDALRVQLATLPTAAVAERALASSWACVARSREEAARLANRVAAEHLQLHVADAEEFAPSVRHAGAVFVGAGAAEVLGDYGVGPNHTLPTGGAARFQAGLSVLDFLRLRTFVAGGGGDSGGDRGGASAALATDAAALARMEGLEAHARAAERRAGAGLGGGVGARA